VPRGGAGVECLQSGAECLPRAGSCGRAERRASGGAACPQVGFCGQSAAESRGVPSPRLSTGQGGGVPTSGVCGRSSSRGVWSSGSPPAGPAGRVPAAGGGVPWSAECLASRGGGRSAGAHARGLRAECPQPGRTAECRVPRPRVSQRAECLLHLRAECRRVPECRVARLEAGSPASPAPGTRGTRAGHLRLGQAGATPRRAVGTPPPARGPSRPGGARAKLRPRCGQSARRPHFRHSAPDTPPPGRLEAYHRHSAGTPPARGHFARGCGPPPARHPVVGTPPLG
jgi:hypothetical protein